MNENGSALKKLARRLYLSLKPSNRIIVLDHPIEAKPLYSLSNPNLRLQNYFEQFKPQYQSLLISVLQYAPFIQTITPGNASENSIQPVWNNDFVPPFDMILLYTILCTYRPKKYVEIGSGTTTKIANKARKEQNLDFTITCIDPRPRQEIQKIADVWLDQQIQKVDLSLFRDLSENDIVFFDGTHMMLPNSDVAWFFLEILPSLPKGVIVQVHDIYLPYDYPQFMLDRYYSENYVLGVVLLSNPEKYEVMAPVFYISNQQELASIVHSLWDHPNLQNTEKHGGSFWFKIK
jgi:hypothetical protein